MLANMANWLASSLASQLTKFRKKGNWVNTTNLDLYVYTTFT